MSAQEAEDAGRSDVDKRDEQEAAEGAEGAEAAEGTEGAEGMESAEGTEGAEEAEGADSRSDRKQGKRSWKYAATVVVLIFVSYWLYVFLPLSNPENPDLLSDAAFGRRAEVLCASAEKRIAELPGAAQADDPEDRSVQVTDSTDVWEELADELEAIATEAEASDYDLISAWLNDWREYLEDRRNYAKTLAEGEDPPFLISTRRGRGVTEYISAFAEANGMPSCATPDDV